MNSITKAKSIWHTTSNYDDRPQIPKNKTNVTCLVEFDNRMEILDYVTYYDDGLWESNGSYTYDFNSPKRWAYLNEISKL